MWPFTKTTSKADLRGYKRITLAGRSFVIQRLNPLLDFPADRMPQIFSEFVQNKADKARRAADPKRGGEDLRLVIEAGVVEPRLVPIGSGEKRGKEDGVTVDDLCRETDTAAWLYMEILVHSLNRFKGIRGVFFSTRTRRWLSMGLRQSSARAPST